MTNGMVAKKLRVDWADAQGEGTGTFAKWSMSGRGTRSAQSMCATCCPAKQRWLLRRMCLCHGGPACRCFSTAFLCRSARYPKAAQAVVRCGGWCGLAHVVLAQLMEDRLWNNGAGRGPVSVNDCVAAPFPSDYRCRVEAGGNFPPSVQVMLGALRHAPTRVLDMAGCETNRRSLMLVCQNGRGKKRQSWRLRPTMRICRR